MRRGESWGSAQRILRSVGHKYVHIRRLLLDCWLTDWAQDEEWWGDSTARRSDGSRTKLVCPLHCTSIEHADRILRRLLRSHQRTQRNWHWWQHRPRAIAAVHDL